MLLQKQYEHFQSYKTSSGVTMMIFVIKFHHLFLLKDFQALLFEGCSKLTLNRRKIAQFQVLGLMWSPDLWKKKAVLPGHPGITSDFVQRWNESAGLSNTHQTKVFPGEMTYFSSQNKNGRVIVPEIDRVKARDVIKKWKTGRAERWNS